LQSEIKINEKVMELDYFWGAVVMVFSHPPLSLKHPNFYYAKLDE